MTACARPAYRKRRGLTIPILGSDAFEGEEFVKSGVADGVMYTVGALKNPEHFKVKVQQVTGVESNLGTPLGYDAIKILAKVMQEVGTDKKAVRDALAKLSYKGISTSLIEFDENGDLTSVAYDVKLIKDGKSTIIG